MAAFVESNNTLALLVVAVCAIIACAFGIAGLLLRMALERVLTEIDSLKKAHAEHDDRLEWIKGILLVNQLIPQGPDPG